MQQKRQCKAEEGYQLEKKVHMTKHGLLDEVDRQAETSHYSSSEDNDDESSTESAKGNRRAKTQRQQHKENVKAQKAARRAKRMGKAPHEVGRKPCDLCRQEVDMLVRCTTDASLQYKMVCGKCWTDVSGGVPDGDANHPFYTYVGVWKNRNANLRKKIGSGVGRSRSHDDGSITDL